MGDLLYVIALWNVFVSNILSESMRVKAKTSKVRPHL